MFQELPGPARILASDNVRGLKHLEGPERDVSQIADGSRNNVKHKNKKLKIKSQNLGAVSPRLKKEVSSSCKVRNLYSLPRSDSTVLTSTF
jgi:hypothetical protein